MNRDTVIALAKKADLWMTSDERIAAVERFAALVSAHEREECAKVAKQWDSAHPNTNYGGCIANLIRSRE